MRHVLFHAISAWCPFVYLIYEGLMRPTPRELVRDLYRRFLVVGRDYPRGLNFVRTKAKEAFYRNAHLTDEDSLMRAVAKGRWWVKELIGVVQLKKYRALRARYGDAAAGVDGALERRFDEETAAAPPSPPPTKNEEPRRMQ